MLKPRLTARAFLYLLILLYESNFVIESAFYYPGSIVGRPRVNHNNFHLITAVISFSNRLSSLRSITEPSLCTGIMIDTKGFF